VVRFKLKKIPVLEGFSKEFNGIKITELKDIEIHSLALPSNNTKKAVATLKKNFGCTMPVVGQSFVCQSHNLKILRLSTDQLFLFSNNKNLSRINRILTNLEESFFITEQTDAWFGLKISGEKVLECLNRICQINISLDTFAINAFARTVMEHLGTIIIRNKTDEFELFSASSSAKSFLHAVETSVNNI
jgi:sarcosine oxidase subunit gamma